MVSVWMESRVYWGIDPRQWPADVDGTPKCFEELRGRSRVMTASLFFLDVSRETLTFCPPNIEKKFPIKGGIVRQKQLGKMIKIDFFDANGRFVVRHIVEMEPMRTYPFIWARVYCKEIFAWYKNADFAKITIYGLTQVIQRYE